MCLCDKANTNIVVDASVQSILNPVHYYAQSHSVPLASISFFQSITGQFMTSLVLCPYALSIVFYLSFDFIFAIAAPFTYLFTMSFVDCNVMHARHRVFNGFYGKITTIYKHFGALKKKCHSHLKNADTM